MPDQWLKRDWRGNYRGQKQIWFLLRLVAGIATSLCGRAISPIRCVRWTRLLVPMESVIDFKRDVYQKALSELARYLRRPARTTAHRRPPPAAPRTSFRETRARASRFSGGVRDVFQKTILPLASACSWPVRVTPSRRKLFPSA